MCSPVNDLYAVYVAERAIRNIDYGYMSCGPFWSKPEWLHFVYRGSIRSVTVGKRIKPGAQVLSMRSRSHPGVEVRPRGATVAPWRIFDIAPDSVLSEIGERTKGSVLHPIQDQLWFHGVGAYDTNLGGHDSGNRWVNDVGTCWGIIHGRLENLPPAFGRTPVFRTAGRLIFHTRVFVLPRSSAPTNWARHQVSYS
jgi:hypothetical protein